MAEAIVGPLLSKLQDVVLTEAKALAAVGEEIENLSDKLMWLQALVHEADLRSRHNGSRLIRVLAFQIRDVSFEAEDAVDEFYLKGDLSRRFGLYQRFGRNWGRAAVELVVHFRTHFCVRFALSSKIQSMNARLEEIINNSSKYGMRQGRSGNAMTWRASRSIPLMRDYWENSAPFKLIGRDSKKGDLKDMLIDDHNKVIRVVGPAGIGKTALLEDALGDEDIKKHFKVLVRVSFSRGTIKSSTIETLIIDKLNEACSRARTYPEDARCLVVIDGPAIRTTTWLEVLPKLQQRVAGQGSKILLTQAGRDELMSYYGNIIELTILSPDDTNLLFDHLSSLGGTRKIDLATITRRTIQDDIEKITNGQPLAVVLLAKFMSTIPYGKWKAASEYIKRNGEDHLLRTILSVCIDDLPDELKSCFLYAAGLPKKKDIDARQLVRLWMAEGFLTQKEGLETEELGQCFLKELVYRGLLQLIRKTWSADGGCVEFVRVPDQIHSFIRLEARRTSFMDFHYGGSVPPPANTRRLAFLHMYNNKKLVSAPSSCLDKLRTMVSYSEDDEYTHYERGLMPAGATADAGAGANADGHATPNNKEKERIPLRKLLRGSPFLRVIHLEVGLDQEIQLPDEIGEMVHLQYLGVRCSLLTRVPSSIGNLGRLQTLDVRGTEVKELPKSLWKIPTLRHVLGVGLIFPTSSASRDLKLMQTLETVTIPIRHIHIWCTDICRRRKNKFGLRFLRRLCVIDINPSQWGNLNTILKELSYLEYLSLSGSDLHIDLFTDASFLNNVASLELKGQLWPKNPTRDVNQIRDAKCLPNLTRLVLRQSKIGPDFINAIGMLPILAELELQENSYEGTELDLCSQRFNSLLVLRITSLLTLHRVTVPGARTNSTTMKKAIDPIFSDDMPVIKCDPHISCSYCRNSSGGHADAGPRPAPAAANGTGGQVIVVVLQPHDANATSGLADVGPHAAPAVTNATGGQAGVVPQPPPDANATGGQVAVEQQRLPVAGNNDETNNGGDEGARSGNEHSPPTTGGEESSPPDHDYRKMILEAIKVLERRGENTQGKIVQYIKHNNGDHIKQMAIQELRNEILKNLDTMVQSRELIKSGRWSFFCADPQQ